MQHTRSMSFLKIYYAVIMLSCLLIVGIFGFMNIEGYKLLDAFYMTVITLSTVGFREIKPLTEDGKMFTIFLIISSFGIFAYSISAITNYIIDGEFKTYFKALRVQRNIKNLKGHTIICGYGRNGKQAAKEFLEHNRPYIIIEKDPAILDKLNHQSKVNFIEGDATNDEVLEQVGIEKAGALITTLPKDADNLFVVLTSRELNPNLLIISRASDDHSDKKLRRAGANNVIMPDKIGGAHMASLVLKPNVIEFFDYILGQSTGRVNIEELSFDSLPEQYKNASIKDLDIRKKTGANIIGFKTTEGEYIINPDPDSKFISDSKLFVLGTPEQITSLKSLLNV